MIITCQHINDITKAGRLGNQMFIIASIFGIAKTAGVNFAFPKWNYEEAFNSDLPRIPSFIDQFECYRESHHGYDPNLIKYINNNPDGFKWVNIIGYLQDYRYFDAHRNHIVEQFGNFKEIIPKTCSIHVRRGDYLNYPNHHPCCPVEYYKDSAKYIRENANISKFMIFSDDIEWCRKIFKGENVEFVPQGNEVEDMKKMASCEHNIIANSSYSWWAGYLNPNPDKIIIRPKRWFGNALSSYNTEGYNMKGIVVI